MLPIWPYLLSELELGNPCALITVLQTRGSTPREQGARMVVSFSSTLGTIGGGELEHRGIKAAQKAMQKEDNQYWTSDYPLGPELGQCCGGHVTLLTEIFSSNRMTEITPLAQAEKNGQFTSTAFVHEKHIERQLLHAKNTQENTQLPTSIEFGKTMIETFGIYKTPLAVFGCGHVAKALMLALAPLPFQVTLFDQRPNIFPKKVPTNITCIVPKDPTYEVSQLPDDAQILIMTHDHALDLTLAHTALIQYRFSYVGLIGSTTKKNRFLKRLIAAGLKEHHLQSLICPIGVAGLNSKEPSQIATAVATQLLIYRQETITQNNNGEQNLMKQHLFKTPMTKEQFITIFGELYECSPWVAQAVWPDVVSGVINHAEALMTAMQETVNNASDDQKTTLLRAHPELAGKAAIAGNMTNASKQEQSSAGLNQCTPEEFKKFQELNTAYLDKFNFPFIIAVTGLTRADIIKAFETRTRATIMQEFSVAIDQVHAIAAIRFAQIDQTIFSIRD